MPVISKETAQRHLDMWLEAEAAVSTGQSYQIEQMVLTRASLKQALEWYRKAAEGGNALFAGCAYGEIGELYIFCYTNDSGDELRQYGEQEVVTYYMNAGATDVRMRTLGGRRFICYRATVNGQGGEETWDTYETWNEDIQISFETRMNPDDVLPILATITFTSIAQTN